MPAETAVLRELKAAGVLTDAWTPGRPGAVLMLEIPSTAEAERLAESLPLVRAGLITTEVVPLHPMDL